MSKEQLYHYNDTIDQLQQENAQLKKELAEEVQKQLRHEICEKIREFIHSKECQVKGMEFVWLLQKLDQIERGDE